MNRPPYGIEGPYRAKRKPIKRYVAIAALVVVGITVVLLTGCSNLPFNS